MTSNLIISFSFDDSIKGKVYFNISRTENLLQLVHNNAKFYVFHRESCTSLPVLSLQLYDDSSQNFELIYHISLKLNSFFI